MVIQSGKVIYGRTVKTGDYENKRIDIELAFTVDDGQDAEAVVGVVGQMAVKKAHELLGLKAPAVAPTTEQANGAKEAAAERMNAAEGKAPKPPRAPKPAPAKPEPKPEALKDELEVEQPKAEAPKPETPADDWETAGAAEPPKEITDKELSDAAIRKVTELQKDHQGAAPAMIRKLIATFFTEPAGKMLRDIPQARRQEFLDKLKALS
jgi:hypothetical protein